MHYIYYYISCMLHNTIFFYNNLLSFFLSSFLLAFLFSFLWFYSAEQSRRLCMVACPSEMSVFSGTLQQRPRIQVDKHF